MLRRAGEADLPAIFEVHQRVTENRLPHGFAAFVELAAPLVRAGHCWVWTEGRMVRGDAAYDIATAYIDVLYVDPDYHGRGIGAALLEQCCRDLEQAGHRSASLHTVAGTRAEAFYRTRGWVLDDASDPRNLLYRKELRPAP